nr:hypothetical protein Iba_chr10fCG8030 [Ipomoea batatas]
MVKTEGAHGRRLRQVEGEYGDREAGGCGGGATVRRRGCPAARVCDCADVLRREAEKMRMEALILTRENAEKTHPLDEPPTTTAGEVLAARRSDVPTAGRGHRPLLPPLCCSPGMRRMAKVARRWNHRPLLVAVPPERRGAGHLSWRQRDYWTRR